MPDPTPRQVLERAHAFVRAYDVQYADCFAEDGVLLLPFAPAPFPKRFEGREAIRRLIAPQYEAARAAGRRILDYRDVVLHETADPEVIVIEFEAIGVERDGTTRYQLPFIQVVRVRGGEIVEQRDYFDSVAMTQRLQAT
jgi:ketosteroid isomerase-like protein